MKRERIEFRNATGQVLAGLLDLPDGAPQAHALFAHCFTCGKDVRAAGRIAGALTARGIAVLRFDFTGLGGSEGEFANTGFSSNVEDLVAAADYLRQCHAAPSILIGHSLGGAAVLAAAHLMPEIRAIATIGAPSDPAHVTGLFHDRLEEIERDGQVEVDLAGRTFRINRQFVEDVSRQNLAERIAALRCALLVMHAPLDAVVGIDNASAIFTAARHPKSFVSLDDADHLLSRPADAAYAAAVITAWAARYVGGDADDPAPATEVEAGLVHVRATGEGHFQQEILAGRHRLLADEPAKAGGNDTGPDPYGLLLAALGACTAMTIRMYADRKKLPLAGVSVELRHAKLHVDDCAECEAGQGKVDRIDRVLHLDGDLSGDQRTRLLEIADMCPVHRTLLSVVQIRTELG